MALPVRPEDYHDVMVEAGRDALNKLEASYRPLEPRILPDVSAVTHIEEVSQAGRAKEVFTQHRVEILPDVHPDIVLKSFVPPEYLLAAFCSLSVALASHLSDKRPSQMPVLPPNEAWLRDHIASLWMRTPVESEVNELSIYQAGAHIHDATELVMERVPDSSLWSINYRRQVRTLLMRFDDDLPGEITEV